MQAAETRNYSVNHLFESPTARNLSNLYLIKQISMLTNEKVSDLD